mgnify:CR=1 FL=1
MSDRDASPCKAPNAALSASGRRRVPAIVGAVLSALAVVVATAVPALAHDNSPPASPTSGITLDPATGRPLTDPQTLESARPGIHLAGVVVAGMHTNEVFIENGRFHGEAIVDEDPQVVVRFIDTEFLPRMVGERRKILVILCGLLVLMLILASCTAPAKLSPPFFSDPFEIYEAAEEI